MSTDQLSATAPLLHPTSSGPSTNVTHREFSCVTTLPSPSEHLQAQSFANNAPRNTRIARCVKTAAAPLPRLRRRAAAPSEFPCIRDVSPQRLLQNSSHSWRKPPGLRHQYNRSDHGDRRDLLCPGAQRRRRRSVVLEPSRVRRAPVSSRRLLPLFFS